jgi:hypothetical protein
MGQGASAVTAPSAPTGSFFTVDSDQFLARLQAADIFQ